MSTEKLYTIMRSHGLALHLTPVEEISSWAGVEDDGKLLERISMTDYGRHFEELDDILLEERIVKSAYGLLGERIDFILSILDERTGELVRAYFSKYDIENLRRRFYAAKSEREDVSLGLIPLLEFLPGLGRAYEAGAAPLEAQTLGMEYVERALKEWMKAGAEDLTSLDLLLERSYAEIVRGCLRWPTLIGGAKDVIKAYLNARLMGIGLKALYCGQKERLGVLEGLMDPKAYGIIVKSESVSSALDELAKIGSYSRFAGEAIKTYEKVREPWLLEYSLFKEALEMACETAEREPFSPAYLFWYLIRVEWEARAIEILLLSRREGLSSEIVRGILSLASDLP